MVAPLSSTTTGWAGQGVGSPPRSTWPASRARSRCRCSSLPGTGTTARSSSRFWKPSGCLGSVLAGHDPGQTRPTAPARTAPTYADAASGARSPRRPIRSATARSVGREVADRRSSTRSTTANAMRSSAGSAASSSTGQWPPDPTSSPFGSRQQFTSRRSTSGCESSGGQVAVPC